MEEVEAREYPFLIQDIDGNLTEVWGLVSLGPRQEDPQIEMEREKKEAMETRLRLRSFEEDWNAPGMEEYDKM